MLLVRVEEVAWSNIMVVLEFALRFKAHQLEPGGIEVLDHLHVFSSDGDLLPAVVNAMPDLVSVELSASVLAGEGGRALEGLIRLPVHLNGRG